MDLEQLRQALAALVQRMEAINKGAVNEKGEARSLNETEAKEYRELEAKAKETRDAIRRVEELRSAQADVQRLSASTSQTPTVQIVREEHHDENGEYRGFKSMGDFLVAVARSSVPGRAVDARLDTLQKSIITRASGQSEGVGADGGFLVQTDFQQELWRKTFDASTIAQLCEQATCSAPSNEIVWNEVVEDSRATGSRHGGVRVYRDKEAGTVASSKVQLRREKLGLEKMTAIAYTPEELLEDASGLQSLIEPEFVKEMAWVLDEEIVFSNGNGECLGVMNCGALVTVAKEGNQAADTVEHANVRKMHGRIWAPSEPRALWFIGSGVNEQLEIMTFTPSGGTSIPVYMPANGVSGRKYGTLYGADVRRNEHCPAIGDLGDILYADFSQYRLVRKGGIYGAMSQHVRFIYGEMTFRWTQRVNGKPLWKLPLTPAKGSQTESPFVTLQAR